MRDTSGEVAPQAGDDRTDAGELAASFAAWRQSLEAVKKSITDATVAVGLLNATLLEMAPLWRSLGQLQKALGNVEWTEAMDEAAAAAEEALARAAVPRPAVVARPEEAAAPEPAEPQPEAVPEEAPVLRGARQPPARLEVPIPDGGAPYSYTVTVEEVGSRVKLVPLHQSLSQVKGVRELSLRSYTNGVAVVSVDSEIELDASAFEEALAAGMHPVCRVVSGEGPSFLIRMGGNAASGGQRQREGVK